MARANILVFDNSAAGCDALKDQFSGRANVFCAMTLLEGLSACSNGTFDMVLVGKSVLPAEALDLCEKLKAREEYNRTPIIILPEGGLHEDPRLCFMNPRAEESAEGKFFEFDLYRQEVVLAGEPKLLLQVTSTEFRILLHLNENMGNVVSRPDLIANIWRGQNKISDRTVDKHISGLRKKLGVHGKRLKTLPNKGYILT
jgi:DNA-binding response OmpR family regulator